METSHKDLPLGFLINTVGRLIFEETQRHMDGMQVEVIELGILWLVDAFPGRQQAEYARFQRRDATTFGRYTDKLEGKGLLARDAVAGDRRANALVLTSQGRAVLAEGRKRVYAAQAAVIGPKTATVDEISDFLTGVLASQGPGIGTKQRAKRGEDKPCND